MPSVSKQGQTFLCHSQQGTKKVLKLTISGIYLMPLDGVLPENQGTSMHIFEKSSCLGQAASPENVTELLLSNVSYKYSTLTE